MSTVTASLFKNAPKPNSLLGYHRLLSPSAAVRVSPLCLGAMNFGEAWKPFMGECTKETAFQMLDFFHEQGGNFIDTANNYQAEESEQWIGEWMEKRGTRDEMVIATKFTTGYRTGVSANEHLKSNFQGNHSKSLKLSVTASLKKLKTDYIDLLYVHWWDFSTSIPELMNSLHHQVASGRVLYIGISDTPAWLVVKCNEYARHHGLTPFSVYQGHWSCAFRDMEREIIPMCKAEGMGIAPWGAIGRGQFKTAEEYAKGEGRQGGPQQDKYIRIGSKLAEIAAKKGDNIPMTSIALAYVMHKTPYVFPIVGGRKVDHLRGNIAALGISLSDKEIQDIDSAEPFELSFPLNFLFGNNYHLDADTTDIQLVQSNTWLETVPHNKPIEPKQGEKRLEIRSAKN